MKHANAFVAIALAFGCGSVQATLVNPGFETGTTGWDIIPSSAGVVVTSSDAEGYSRSDGTDIGPDTYFPKEGDYFLKLETGETGLDWRTYSQSTFVDAGQTLSGYAAFDWNDYGSFQDEARVSILNDSGDEIARPFSTKGDALFPIPSPGHDYDSDFSYGPWTLWSWTAQTAGTYTLQYGVINGFDDSFSSYGYFDTVPEPASLALFMIGLAGLSTMQRRRTV